MQVWRFGFLHEAEGERLMIIEKKRLNLGPLGMYHCSTCKQERNVFLTILCSYFELFWIPIASWNRKYYCRCKFCNSSVEVSKNEVTSALGKNPLPWIYHFGWTIPVVGIAFLIFFLGIILYW